MGRSTSLDAFPWRFGRRRGMPALRRLCRSNRIRHCVRPSKEGGSAPSASFSMILSKISSFAFASPADRVGSERMTGIVIRADHHCDRSGAAVRHLARVTVDAGLSSLGMDLQLLDQLLATRRGQTSF